MNILGILSSFSVNQHDPGAALLCDGRLVAVCEEERFCGMKSARGRLPIRSIMACLAEAGLNISDVQVVAHPHETHVNIEDRISEYLRHYFGFAPEITLFNHQVAHLASAFFASGYEQAMCLSYDNSGDKLSGILGAGDNVGLHIVEQLGWENSLGRFYAMMTQWLGFDAGEDEYKVMGLSAYGKEDVDLSSIITPTTSGYKFNLDFTRNMQLSVFEPFYNARLVKLLGEPRRPSEPLTQFHKDVAYATQNMLERCAVSLVTHLQKQTGQHNLCIAGGVGLNCSANLVLRQLPFVNSIFVQPAASDRGLALGCALMASHLAGEKPEQLDNVFYGPTIQKAEIERAMKLTGCRYREVEDPSVIAAEMLANGKIVGWFQGRSEFGPRALGNRSILADPRDPLMKDKVNAKIKFREEFRPFAPAVIEEQAHEYFDITSPSPFMTVAFPVWPGKKEILPSVTHVNGTARVQTVSKKTNPMFHKLIERFGELTGVPVVLNTSFNVRGKPIVETPFDAIATFAASGIDAVFMHSYVLTKAN